ncbi:tensin homolog [Drosophila willistoni]|uniref:tensin homolog n=1 Tax=Drosophila willistoni TaxID=7260 RepID=UPI00017D947E|nr:tensin homolog [Drosophila willistoni]
MESVHVAPSVPIPIDAICQFAGEERHSSESDDTENIPYHARENARPFTYGNLPQGFTTSDLNHVPTTEEIVEIPKTKRTQNAYPASPSSTRRNNRPSISPSRPVLRKTPSRQEFEEMLMERKEQSLREQNNIATKLAQNAAIQKDLDELHERLNKTILSPDNRKADVVDSGKQVVRHVESIDLPDEGQLCVAPVHPHFEPALIVVDRKRPETPTFPVMQRHANSDRCVSPYLSPRLAIADEPHVVRETIREKPRAEPKNHTQEVEPHLVKFAKDSSEYWYKPHMTREEAVLLLRNATPGKFLIRDSTTYRDAYGLVLRVAKPPPGVGVGASGDELVRHFLLEPTTRGVRLKGCANEPIFSSLSAFVYQHSINQLALPCTLIIPDQELLLSSRDEELISKQKQVLQQGAACNVLYLFQSDMESLTGDEAVRKAVFEMNSGDKRPIPIEVHFKISQQGITLTDNTRKKFFRRHYAAQNISHFGMDPNNRFWSVTANDEGLQRSVNKSIFAFVARPLCGSKDNQCHIFCDLASSQPASAIVSFAHKVLPLDKSNCKML